MDRELHRKADARPLHAASPEHKYFRPKALAIYPRICAARKDWQGAARRPGPPAPRLQSAHLLREFRVLRSPRHLSRSTAALVGHPLMSCFRATSKISTQPKITY